MQCIYALIQSREEDLDKQQKFLHYSITSAYDLYLVMMDLFAELHKLAEKHVIHDQNRYLKQARPEVSRPNKFIENRVLSSIRENKALNAELRRRKLAFWDLHGDYVKLIYEEVVNSTYYSDYMKEANTTFDEDRKLLIDLFTTIIAPNEKIYDFFEDARLTWIDDVPLVNTFILKQLRQLGPKIPPTVFTPKLLKDDEDLVFAKDLLAKTLLKDQALSKEIEGKTPNWDKDRIADIDGILLKMAICELLYFPSIPERVTINEYLEIAKEYSTPKSSIFINGILDKLVKEYKADGKLKKVGRGLL